jgi:hypothetical protein
MLHFQGSVPGSDSTLWQRVDANRIEGTVRGSTSVIFLKVHKLKRESQVLKAISAFTESSGAEHVTLLQGSSIPGITHAPESIRTVKMLTISSSNQRLGGHYS